MADDWTPGGAALTIPCGRCEAKIGEPCTTISGQPTEPHVARWGPLGSAYSAGYLDAEATP